MPLQQNIELLLHLILACFLAGIVAVVLYMFFVVYLSNRKGLR